MKKIVSLALVVLMLVAVMMGCSKLGTANGTGDTAAAPTVEATEAPVEESTEALVEEVTVKFLNMKVEIADALTKMIPEFEAENPGIKLEIETVGGGADYSAAVMAKFQSGEAPDIWNDTGFSDLEKWSEKVEDLSDQPWIGDMIDGAEIPITIDGKIYGLPLAVEGFGFAYNKTLFAQAGITELPDTLSSLDAACQRLQDAGIQPFSNSYAEWWVLGMHNLNLLLAQQDDPAQFIAEVAAGNEKIKDNPATAGWVALLDLTAKYGEKNPTTTGDYASSVAAFASGQAAMIQQGNWIQPDLDKVDASLDVGFLPMPTSENPEDKINAGIPNYLVVNNESPVKEQAKVFLNWLVTSETGRRYITEEFKALPAFKSINSDTFTGLNAALIEYTSAGKTYPWVFPQMPNGSTELIGASMMKYLGVQITVDQMCDEMDQAIIDRTAAAVQ